MRVLVVDDTAVFRRAVSDALAGLPGVEVVGTANNGRMALGRLAALRPDLMTLDIEMPEMNGIEVLEAMPADSPVGVIVLSALTVRGGEMTTRALESRRLRFRRRNRREGRREENLAQLRNSLAPILRAFERRREIRSILGANPGNRLSRRPWCAVNTTTGTQACPSWPADAANPSS